MSTPTDNDLLQQLAHATQQLAQARAEIGKLKSELKIHQLTLSQRAVAAAKAIKEGTIKRSRGFSMRQAAARRYFASDSYVRDALFVGKKAPSLLEEIEQGRLELGPAVKSLKAKKASVPTASPRLAPMQNAA